MIYIAAFVFFIVFFLFMGLGYILQKKGLKSENEANEILEGLTCASCTTSCTFAGQRRKPTKKCQADLKIPSKTI